MNVLIEFDIPGEPLTMNDRHNTPQGKRYEREVKNDWLAAAHYATVAAFPGVGPAGRVMPPCEVYVSIPVPGHRNRDPHNWYPTVKAIIDGVRIAGVWPDDDQRWVHTHEPALREVAPADLHREKVYVRLVPRKESDADGAGV